MGVIKGPASVGKNLFSTNGSTVLRIFSSEMAILAVDIRSSGMTISHTSIFPKRRQLSRIGAGWSESRDVGGAAKLPAGRGKSGTSPSLATDAGDTGDRLKRLCFYWFLHPMNPMHLLQSFIFDSKFMFSILAFIAFILNPAVGVLKAFKRLRL